VRAARFIALGILLIALCAQFALGERRSVTRKVRIGEGATTFVLSCPKGHAALNGGTYPTASDVVTSYSGPVKGLLRRWRFGFDAEGPATVRASVRCRRIRFPKRVHARFQVQSLARNEITVNSGATRRVRLRCEKGLVPTGWGQSQTPGGASEPGAIDLYSVIPSRRGFRVGLRSQSTEDAQINLYLRCWRRKLRGQLARVRVREFRNKVPANGRTRIRHTCRRGEFSLATGWSFASRSGLAVSATRAAGARRARWLFDNGGGRAKARTSILCLARQR
jgi:hypothetical protein